MFDDKVEKEQREMQLIASKLNTLLEKFNVSKESLAVKLNLYLDVLIDILRGCSDAPIKYYREYFQKIEGYLMGW